MKKTLLSVVVPVFNKSLGLEVFNVDLTDELKKNNDTLYEIIYCDDGSTDNSSDIIKRLAEADSRVKLLSLSRNFGKEYALSAGIHYANGDCVISLDADGQHPPRFIHDFIDKWQKGIDVVVGVRSGQKNKPIRSLGSTIFYKLFNALSKQEMMPG